MWREYFKLIRLKPGRVITHLCGEIDFRKDNLPLDVLKKLYENDFPYLEITEKGRKELYGIIQESFKTGKNRRNLKAKETIEFKV